MVFSHTNRKGTIFYLHERRTKTGKARYVFAKDVRDGALSKLPDGYVVRESINGLVSLAKQQPTIITEAEEQTVRSALKGRSLDRYRIEVRGESITVFEPRHQGSTLESTLRDIFGPGFPVDRIKEVVDQQVDYDPVLRFVLDDRDSREFHAERVTYRGEGGWSYPLRWGKLSILVKKLLPHLGKESFFELH